MMEEKREAEEREAEEREAETHEERAEAQQHDPLRLPSPARPWPPPGQPPALPKGWRCALARRVASDDASDSPSLAPYWYNVETLQVSWQPPGRDAARHDAEPFDMLQSIARGLLRWERIAQAWERCLPDGELLRPFQSCMGISAQSVAAAASHEAVDGKKRQETEARSSLDSLPLTPLSSRLSYSVLLGAVTRLQAAARGLQTRRRYGSPKVRMMRAEEERRQRHAFVTTHRREPEYRPVASLMAEGSASLASMMAKRRAEAERAAIETTGKLAGPRYTRQPSPPRPRTIPTLPVVLAPGVTGGSMPRLPSSSSCAPDSPEAVAAYSAEAKRALERASSNGQEREATTSKAASGTHSHTHSASLPSSASQGVSQGAGSAVARAPSAHQAPAPPAAGPPGTASSGEREGQAAVVAAREWTSFAISPAQTGKASRAAAQATRASGPGAASGGSSQTQQQQHGGSLEDRIHRGMLEDYLSDSTDEDGDDGNALDELERAKAEGRAKLVKLTDQDAGIRAPGSGTTGSGERGATSHTLRPIREDEVIQDL